MRFVLSDDDQMFRSIVESVITGQGHEVVGVAETTVGATELVHHARPDAVVIDLTLGYNTDFDVVSAAAAIGARVIIFSFQADQVDLSEQGVTPIAVVKPDFVALERAIAQLAFDEAPALESDRRRRPQRVASGPVPTGLGDAQAFYEALNNAVEGDTLLSITLPEDTASVEGTEAIAERVAQVIRHTDRLLGSMSAVHVFLAGGDVEGTESLTSRLHDQVHPPGGTAVRSVVVQPAESSAEAFDRLKRAAAGDR